MPRSVGTGLQLAEVLSALSYALDLTEGQPPGHCLRSCWIGVHLGRELGLGATELRDVYYTTLLKDSGCSSNAARLCELYHVDDREIKQRIKLINLQSAAELGKFVVANAGVGTGFWTRVRLVLDFVRNGDRIAGELVLARCERGAEIARQLGFGPQVAGGIRSLDEHWNGKGRPDGLRGDAIPLPSRIALLAQVVDVFFAAEGKPGALAEIRRRSGKWFDPEVVRAMNSIAAKAELWDALADEDLESRVIAIEPEPETVELSDDRLDSIAEAFGQVIDAKSPFTSGHSERVAIYCDLIAEALDLDHGRRRWLRRAARLHDIGKLGVSNAILDKPGKLTAEEWAEVEKHPMHTHDILSRIGPFQDLAFVAGAHHERLDGGGYPWGLEPEQIPLETRMISVADVFDAISADRPYRSAMPLSRVRKIMDELSGPSLDPRCWEALRKQLPEDDAADSIAAWLLEREARALADEVDRL